ncbi:glycosyltransferase [Altibacter sp. HG106]|uniref:glycosyltransferase n=1 Tax=Altibacter sp. HG106 TaxID=3023937 RepID=UPI0023502C97|nr:glycosyltransferase [Altibacter sp. HG106]MDC7995358.1 glycosyltransferase [Altibacter sp. HG106]
MRVLILINSLRTGGAEKLVHDSILGFKAHDMEVALALLDGTSTPFLESLQEQTNCTIHSLSKGSVYQPLLIIKIRRLLSQYDLIHVHLFPALYWAAIASLGLRRKPKMIYTEHSTSNRRRSSWLGRLDSWIYGRYTTIITITDEVKEALVTHIPSIAHNCVVIANGVSLQAIREASPSREDIFDASVDFKILQVSRFHPPKDQATVIRALQHLPNSVGLILVGEGPTQTDCVELAASLTLSHRVAFLGVRKDIPELLKASNVVILSSGHEGLSLASLEGMASGRPFVASSVPGLKDLVEGAGLLFPKGDDAALAETIAQLRNDDKMYRETVHRCIERAQQYDIAQTIDQHIELYKDTLK